MARPSFKRSANGRPQLTMSGAVELITPRLRLRPEAELDERGWSNWAVEQVSDGASIGFVGLNVPWRALPFMPCVEIGYRLSRQHWGKGFATEAGREALRFGFEELKWPEVVSFTAKLNVPSQAVMQRLGMPNANEDFDHPALPEYSPLRPHCLYRLSRERWVASGA